MPEKTSQKKGAPKTRSSSYVVPAVIAIIVVAVFAYLLFTELQGRQVGEALVLVNGVPITQADLDLAYSRIPVAYQEIFTKDDYLDQLISQEVLRQEAEHEGFSVTDVELTEAMDELRAQFPSEVEFMAALEAQSITVEELEGQLRMQLAIGDLINETVTSKIAVSDQQVRGYYDDNIEQMVGFDGETILFVDAEGPIRDLLVQSQAQDAIDLYIQQLRAAADIQRPDAPVRREFMLVGEEECMQDGLPVMRMYTSSTCPDCDAAEAVFMQVTAGFPAHLWELDTGDDLLTPVVETSLPRGEYAALLDYDPQGAVPAYLLGCTRVRLGNAYEDFEATREAQSLLEAMGG